MKPILVHCHIFYPELWEELKSCIKNIAPNPFDLFVTMVEEHNDVRQDIQNNFSKVHIDIVKNVGYDVAPFVSVLNKINLEDYSYVVKLHTKRPTINPPYFRNLINNEWSKALLSFIQSKEAFNLCLKAFEENKNIGMISDYKAIVQRELNDKNAQKVLQNFIKEHNFPRLKYRFVAGTMFIARAEIFAELKNLHLTDSDFPAPNAEHSMQLAHVIERFLGYSVYLHNMILTDINKTESFIDKYLSYLTFKHYVLQPIKRFFYQKKITKSGALKIKVCKIPVSVFSRLFKVEQKNSKYRIYLLGIKIFTYKQRTKYVDVKKYASWLYDLKNNHSQFVPFSQEDIVHKEGDIKAFAFYLPQYHSIKENDETYGKGFTEWTNVASASPQFIGHEQPKIPYDLGFYNLLQPGVMERQIEIAKAYGLYGFCFYYYWFSGKKVLEKPLEYFLKSDINFKFHFCWANENWSKLWDGGNKEIILEQKLEKNDAEKFFADILPYIKDERYEKIDNSPLLMIYRPSLFEKEKFLKFINKINELAKKEGFNGFYIMASSAFNFDEPQEYGCKGIIEFPPHKVTPYCNEVNVKRISKLAKFKVLDIKPYISKQQYIYEKDYTIFKTVFPSWDNTPRKLYSQGICFQIKPQDYENWLKGIIAWTQQHNNAKEQYVYINAWNEWAEGAILEPTTKYGYTYLSILRSSLQEAYNKSEESKDAKN